MRPTLFLTLALIAAPALAQAPSASASISCSVRIRPIAAADYNPSSELTLRGTVAEVRPGIVLLRLPYGLVRVQVGARLQESTPAVGQSVEVVASKWQDDQGQRFVARELRFNGSTLVLRDAQGVPVGS